jgi:hypothetical protein
MRLKLDPKTIPALALPKGKAEDFAWDTELEGFGLRVRRRASGDLLRTFVAQYRAGGHSRHQNRGRRQDHRNAGTCRRPQVLSAGRAWT